MNIDILLDKGAKMPTKAHDTDAGFDLYTPYEFTVKANGSAVVQTGVHMVIPKNFCGVVISKSGLLTRQDITTTGLVDAAYTGEIVIKVQNNGNKDYHFNRGDKVTQIMILPVPEVELVEVEYLPFTERGDRGFGSSGR